MLFKKNILTPVRKISYSYFYYPKVSVSSSSSIKEKKIKIGKYEINYLTVGHGPHNVFCGPGTLGTIWTDYKPQIDAFDRNKFSLVICDLPGSGKSSLPEDDTEIHFFRRDAEVASELMKALQIPRYSYMGWSCSGASGLILAATYPEVINKLVIWGTSSHLLPNEIENYKKIKDLNNWSKPALDTMIKMYGKEEFVKKVSKWVENIENHSKLYTCDHLLKDVKCPTLILYGAKDQMVDASHVKYLEKHVKNSTVHLYPEGRHNIHIKYAEDFNRRVQDFLLSTNE